jgi:hypothetical protein
MVLWAGYKRGASNAAFWPGLVYYGHIPVAPCWYDPMKSLHWLSVAAFAVLSGCSTCGENEPAPSDPDSQQSAQSLLKRLQTENVNYECEEVPLGDVFNWFSMNLGLGFELSSGIQQDCAVTIALYHNTIAAALDRLCLRYDLAWKVEEQTIVVEPGALAQRSAELRELLRTRKSWIACEEEPLRSVFGDLARNGMEIVFDPDVDLNLVVSFEFPHARLCDLLHSLTKALELEWVVYGGAVHIERSR